MRLLLLFPLTALLFGADGPQYTSGGQLQWPGNYREWTFVSSGLGMTYGPAAAGATAEDPRFDNVFAAPAAYRSFLKNGTWPDKTILVLEIRGSQSKGSINQGGHFQDQVRAIEVEVKDESRFSGKWGFFDFGQEQNPAKQLCTTATCYACHAKNGQVDNTFVQFYPTLLPVSREKGTLKKQ